MSNEIVQLEEYQRALAQVETVQEAGALRAKIEAIAKQIAPRLRQDRFKWCKGNIEACITHGEMWNACEMKRGRGQQIEKNLDLISISDAYFKNHMDARMCAAIATLEQEQLCSYFEECEDTNKMPSLGGAYRYWLKFNPMDEVQDKFCIFNDWYFSSCDERFGSSDYPGRMPGQIVINLLHYFTEEGDILFDPFAGGGTSIDVCKYMNRKIIATDIQPAREDIQTWDITQGLPPLESKPKLILLDPPYWNQKQGEYSEHETNLANLPLEEFHSKLEDIILECLDQSEITALIIGATQIGPQFVDHAAEMIARIGAPTARIIVRYTTQQYTGIAVNRAKGQKHMLNIYRDLLIWEN